MNLMLKNPPPLAPTLPSQHRSQSIKTQAGLPRREGRPPTLTFSPLAWLKLQFFCHAGETEVGGFGVCGGGGDGSDNPLYVSDFVTVVQRTTGVTVRFDDDAVADYFDRQFDAGLVPSRFARIWLHTHPGDSSQPSLTDEETFERVFGGCDWAVMFIVSRTGRTYARLRLSAGPGAELPLAVAVDWGSWAGVLADGGGEGLGGQVEAWMDEYGQNVRPEPESFRAIGRSPECGSRPPACRVTVPCDRDLIPAWDGEWWESDPELAALAQMEAELDHDAFWSRRYDWEFDDQGGLYP